MKDGNGRDPRIETVLKDSVPGRGNQMIIERLNVSKEVVSTVVEDLNNWVQVEKVHVYPDNRVGVTARYRWTIERFIATDMENIIRSEGYGIAPHLEADWRGREESEIEYRVRKEIDGTRVFVNLLVEMTSRAFRALNTGETLTNEKKIKREKIDEYLSEKQEAKP